MTDLNGHAGKTSANAPGALSMAAIGWTLGTDAMLRG